MSTSTQHQQHAALPRRRVKQLSSVKAWCQTYGMALDSESDVDLTSYESFPDLRKLLEVECAEIERRELQAKASIEAHVRRRISDPLSDASSASSERSSNDHGGSRLIGSFYRLIDPIIPVLGSVSAASNNHSASASSSSSGSSKASA
ncbi:hypothetical protein H4R24_002369 [Coemansia sp. RSA 988]|nr:hypothetical protein H4R24_002369 [Coemansia sp. RSA 988]